MADYVEEKKWDSGETLLTFCEKHGISQQIYYNLPKDDQSMVEEIMQGVRYHILKTDDNKIRQVLIPISQELQIHIDRDKVGKYHLSIIPVSYQKEESTLMLSVKNSPYQDIINETKQYLLANEFVSAYKKSINFKRFIQKGDRLAIVYEQNKRLGQTWGMPIIKSAMVETRKRPNYIFLGKDGTYYDDKGKAIEGFLLTRPLKRYSRISSGFTLKRWHPVLKRYRAHHGVDYAAPRGTPVYAAGNGRVVSVRYRGGYGKTVEIRHEDGYSTLYAHLKSYARGMRKGKYVKKGQFIARVGNTGLSTGPHLHFGLYKRKRPINPARAIRVTKKILKGNKRKEFLKDVKLYKDRIASILDSGQNIHIDKDIRVYVTKVDEHFRKIMEDKNM
jgi:murein DD-endopeptidase MepM/ murein hydrolase activator NlpD